MDANAQYELYLIKKELQGIIDELDSVSLGVRRDFSGIGNDRCANSVLGSANHYREVKKQLEKMDLSALSDEFMAKQEEEARKAAQAASQKAAASNSSSQQKQSSSQPKQSSAKSSSASGSKSGSKQSSKSSNSATSIVKEALSWLFG